MKSQIVHEEKEKSLFYAKLSLVSNDRSKQSKVDAERFKARVVLNFISFCQNEKRLVC